MAYDRRMLVLAGMAGAAGLGAAASAATAGPRPADTTSAHSKPTVATFPPSADHTSALQAAIDRAASKGEPLMLPAGDFTISSELQLRPSLVLCAADGRTRIVALRPSARLIGRDAHGLVIRDLVIAGAPATAATTPPRSGLVDLGACKDIRLDRLVIETSPANGLSLEKCSGTVQGCRITGAAEAGMFAVDSRGLEIAHNTVADCANNGILVWTSEPAEDGSIVAHNRVERIGARRGGSGQYGNGVNVFRAGSVMVTGNRISDCAFSAVRGNAASNLQIIANNCSRSGEVALYAEFAFEGAVIQGNLVDIAATGISVTNFNEGGRLAVVQGNLVRNLFRREAEPQDKRGEGIAVEADAAITGNVVEGAPTAGLFIGWGRYMRDVAATGNLVRDSRIGIAVQAEREAGAVLIANNMVSGARDGAIRAMAHHEPVGADLARAGARPPANVVVQANMAS